MPACSCRTEGDSTVDLVEHLLAAAAGLGIRHGLEIDVAGPELPLLDGGARRFADALLRLGLRATSPSLVIVRAAELSSGTARYQLEPAEGVSLEVEVTFDHPAIGTPARTVGRRRRAFPRPHRAGAHLRLHEGRASASPRPGAGAWRRRASDAGDHRSQSRGSFAGIPRPPERREVARHKLLDLVGDLGGLRRPPAGRHRPPSGPATPQRITSSARALARGILARR